MRTGAEGTPIGGGGKSNTVKRGRLTWRPRRFSRHGLATERSASICQTAKESKTSKGTTSRSRDARGVRVGAAKRVLEIKRAQGRPGAGRTHGPPATKKAGGSHHRLSQIIRPSLHDGFNGYSALSPVTIAWLPPSSAKDSAALAPASERQDHTTSPSASASFVRATCAPTPPASIASRTHVS